MNYRIKDLREDFDFSQADVARHIGMYTTTYQRYERGEREVPLCVAVKIAQFYNVSLDYLAGIIDKPRRPDGSPFKIGNVFINQNGNMTNNFH